MDGILLIDKPSGMTSHDVVDFIRRKFRIKRVGHSGTLDPMATGLLIILLGRATRLSRSFAEFDKEYEASLTLGESTDTQDAQGKTVFKSDIEGLDESQINEGFLRFKGEIEQIPPMVSAIKYKGKRLYELARNNQIVPRQPRKVQIYKLEITKIDLPRVDFHIVCSKGTYIRTLCEDIGKRLGCGGYLSRLRRIRIGPYILSKAISLDEVSIDRVLHLFGRDSVSTTIYKNLG